MRIELRSMKWYDGHTIVVQLTGNEFIYLHTVAGYSFPGFKLLPYGAQRWQVLPVGRDTIDHRHVQDVLHRHFSSQVEMFSKRYLVQEKSKVDEYHAHMYGWDKKHWIFSGKDITRSDARDASGGLVKRVRNQSKVKHTGAEKKNPVNTTHDPQDRKLKLVKNDAA